MSHTIEPLLKKSPAGPSVPLNTSGPLTRAQLLEMDLCHHRFVYHFILDGSAGLAQGTYDILQVPANTLVQEVNTAVLTEFNAGVTMTVGDGGQADGFLADADMDPDSGSNKLGRSEQAAQTYALGRLYEAKDTIDIVVGGADITAGKLFIEIVCVELDRYGDTTFE